MTSESPYQQLILEHAKSPRHYGEPLVFARRVHGVNPLCGDEVTLFWTPESEAQVLQFVSKGCALCKASASLMLEEAVSSPRPTWAKLKPGPALVEMAEDFPSRARCVNLPWETFAQLVREIDQEIP